ncbi:hypothetical protein IID10_08290 [candidate division KSB1 bacterium]|nr:hypothetical protein [candidate division KSB1 bacterium]
MQANLTVGNSKAKVEFYTWSWKPVPLRSPVREYRTPGSVRGAPGNWRSYLDAEIEGL